MAKIKKNIITSVDDNVEKQNHQTLLMELQSGTAALEMNWQFLKRFNSYHMI